jgi:hypothetical protein
MAGWAIANGNTHIINGNSITTINALNKFIKYSSSSDLTVLGNDEIELNEDNIPEIEFQVNANFNLSGTTNEAGKHNHKVYMRDASSAGCTDCDPTLTEDDPCRTGADGFENATGGGGCIGDAFIGASGNHSHTFNAEAQGNFSSKLGCATPEKININPKHIHKKIYKFSS